MNIFRFKLSAFAILFGLFLSYSNVQVPLLEIPETKNKIIIDGILDNKEYAGFAKIDNYLTWTLDAYIPDKVETFIAFDKKNIYVAFKGHNNDRNSFTRFLESYKPRDSHLWSRHHVRVNISNSKSNILVMGSPTLSVFDMKNGDLSWTGKWEFKANIEQDNKYWTAEFKIPFSEFGTNAVPYGETWKASFMRFQGAQAEEREFIDKVGTYPADTSGQESFGAYENSYWEGQIKFVEKKHLYIEPEPWANQNIGLNQLPIVIKNTGSNQSVVTIDTELVPLAGRPDFINQSGINYNIEYTINVKGEAVKNTKVLTIPKNSEQIENMAYTIPQEGSYLAKITVRNDKDEIIHQESPFSFTICPTKNILKDCLLKLGKCESLTEFKDAEVAKTLLKKTKDLQGRQKKMAAAYPNPVTLQNWKTYSDDINEFEISVLRHLHSIKTAIHNDWKKHSDFGLTVAHSLLKIPKDRFWSPQLREDINVSAASNEYESFQLVILPLIKNSEKYTVNISDFTNENGTVISKKNIELSLVDYNHIPWQSNYTSPGRGWYPDPLIPFDEHVEISSDDLSRPIWVDVQVPDKALPGNYKAIATVTNDAGESHEITIQLKVHAFTLPTTNTLKTHTWDDIHFLSEFYNVDSLPLETYLNLCKTALENNLSPGFAGVNYIDKKPDANGDYDFETVGKVLAYCFERGLNQFSMVQMKKGENAYKGDALEQEYLFIEKYADFLREKGYLEKAVVEIWDEPTENQYLGVKERASRIKAISPDIRTQLFANPKVEPYRFYDIELSKKYGLWDVIDVWAPGSLVDAPHVHSEGKEIWNYIATMARTSAPNLHMESPAINHRLLPYYCWNAESDGFEHWNLNYIWRNVHKGQPIEKKWPNVKWDSRTFMEFHGEGQLIYPGEKGKIYASLRLKAFRDGMDDYEYMTILKNLLEERSDNITPLQKAKALRLLNVGEDFIDQYPSDVQRRLDHTIKYPDRPDLLLEKRADIAQLIDEILMP